jgi:DALR anticodon binding domain
VIFPFSPILIPTLRLLLVSRLQKALQLQYEFFREIGSLDYPEATYLRQQSPLPLHAIPLTFNPRNGQISYTSAIALQLAHAWRRSAPDIATEIYQSLHHSAKNWSDEEKHSPIDEIWEYFSVQIFPLGWLTLHLHQQGLAKWLQILINHPLNLNIVSGNSDNQVNQANNNPAHLFEIQHSHARCYSLLQLFQRVEPLKLSRLTAEKSPTSFFLPCPTVPWLDEEGKFRLCHATEHGLITQLVRTLDAVVEATPLSNPAFGLKLAYPLSQQFQKFYAACPIGGDIFASGADSMSALIQARLGLVLVTQLVLRSLLQDVIGTVAPTEL